MISKAVGHRRFRACDGSATIHESDSIRSVSGIGVTDFAVRDDYVDAKVSPIFVGVVDIHLVLGNQPGNVNSDQFLLFVPVVAPPFEMLLDLFINLRVQSIQPACNVGQLCQDGRIEYGIVAQQVVDSAVRKLPPVKDPIPGDVDAVTSNSRNRS